jgi:pyruvate kinase
MRANCATKIIATLGPTTSSEKSIRGLIKAGVDIFRLNFSHGDLPSHAILLKRIKRASSKLRAPVGTMMDLPGPKIRIGEIHSDRIELKRGDRVILKSGGRSSNDGEIPVNYRNLHRDLRKGNAIFINDGAVKLTVQKITGARITTTVDVGGIITSHKGINIPGVGLSTPSLTGYDRQCVKFGIKEKFDFLAMSFVRKADDVKSLRRLVKSLGGDQFIIAKIEKREAIDSIDGILEQADGVMVARGDLGVEIPIEEVPGVQKLLIDECVYAGVPVITATQVLDSMVHNPRPTRAEAADAANAVLDGTDALMLSQETAIGDYPVEAVRILKAIAFESEKKLQIRSFIGGKKGSISDIADCVARSVCETVEILSVNIIAAPTRTGHTARLISRYRPSAKIIALSENHSTRNHLLLSWGVQSMEINQRLPFDRLILEIKKKLTERKIARPGEKIVITAGSPGSEAGKTNLMLVETI